MCGNYYSSGCGRGYYHYSGCGGSQYSSGCGRGSVGGGITVVAKEDYDNILKDAEKTVNDVCNEADLRKKWIEGLPIENKDIKNKDIKNMCGNFCDLTEKRCKYESNCWCKSTFDIYDPNANPGEGWEWIAACGGGGRWVEVSPSDEYWENYKKQYDKDPKSTAVVIEKNDFNKLMKEAEETVNNINFKSDNVIEDEHKRYEEYCNLSQKRSVKTVDDLKTCENEGCKFCEFGPEQCERFEEFDLMVGPQKCKHWQNKYSGEEYDKTPRTITIDEFMSATDDADEELEKVERMKKAEKETIEKANEGSANILRNTYEKVAKGVGLDESYEEYMDRVHGKITNDIKEATDTSYKHMSDEEMLELLKKDTIDNIMTKLSGQVIDLVDDAMRTAIVDFERAKKVRDTYEATRWTDQALKDDCEKSLKSCIEPQQTVKSDFMNQWVNDMMEKQAKQINMSVINEELYLKKKFVEFLQSLNFKSNIYDIYSTIERKINELKEEIEFSEGFLKDIRNIL